MQTSPGLSQIVTQPWPALNFGQWGAPPGPPIAGSVYSAIVSEVSLGLYALPEENLAFSEFRKIWLPFCEIHERHISRNIFIDAILLHKLLHSLELSLCPPLVVHCSRPNSLHYKV